MTGAGVRICSSGVVTEKYCVTPGKASLPSDGADVADAGTVEGAAGFEETGLSMTGVTGTLTVGMTTRTERGDSGPTLPLAAEEEEEELEVF